MLDFRKFPLMSRSILLIVLPVVSVAYYFTDTFITAALPKGEETIQVSGLSDKAIITRDNMGVVYLKGSSAEDVYFATGYAHAQDRLWQLEVQRRISQGRLSEVFGKSLVNRDIFIRSLGIQEAAERTLEGLSLEAQSALDAYAQGINAWFEANTVLPIEFSILGIQPERWRAVDSVAWSKIFALNLSTNFRDELQFLVAKQYLTEEQLSVFYSQKDEALAMLNSKPEGEIAAQLITILNNLRDEQKLGGKYVGSNAWVVSGQHTVSGNPIIANDPHLGLQQPSLWYVNQQQMPKKTISGMSLIGLPFIIFGQNDQIAWGGTNMMADVQDLYMEKVNPVDPSLYWQDGEWKKFKQRHEMINVRADFPAVFKPQLKPIKVLIRSNERGPIISDVIPGKENVLSLQWIALHQNDKSIDAFYQLNFASDWQSFKHAMSDHKAPALNLFYADVKGNIGFYGVGQVPVRKTGEGRHPLAAETHPNNWSSLIPFDEMPHSFNPESGMLFNANNKNTRQGYPYFISSNFALPPRAQRIQNMLEKRVNSKDKLDLAYMKMMQADVKDLSATSLKRMFSQVEGNTSRQKRAIEMISSWDQKASLDSIAASIFYGWQRHLRSQIFSDELSGYWNKQTEANQLTTMSGKVSNDKLRNLVSENSQWCDDVNTSKSEPCEQVLLSALTSAMEELEKLAGSDLNDWQWGNIQQVLYAHTPFNQVRTADFIFDRQYPSPGSIHTLNVAAGYFDPVKGYVKNFGAGFRQIMEPSSKQPQHLFVNSSGQSGHVASDHYDDMGELMRDIQFVTFKPEQKSGITVLLPQTAKVSAQ